MYFSSRCAISTRLLIVSMCYFDKAVQKINRRYHTMVDHRYSARLRIAQCMLVLLLASFVESDCNNDSDPPEVTCSNGTTNPPLFPNLFFGLTEDISYNTTDANPNPSGITYNVTIGEDLIPPGYSPVTLYSEDICNNIATCLFYVFNPLTELPVTCPDLNRTVYTDPGQATYIFTPDFGPGNVAKSAFGYRYHGDAVSVNITLGGVPVGESVSIGTHEVVATIFDDELEKKCTGIYTVEDYCLTDPDPPEVTCSNATTFWMFPNSFDGLTPNSTGYNTTDANPNPSGISYNVTIGGDLYPPGYTPVTLYSEDICNNIATCLFYVFNPLTELPVNCPELNRTVSTDPHQPTYNFTPDFGADNVTKSALGYRYHGDAVSVNITLGGFPVGGSVSIGTHEVVAIIFDDELEKKCTGIYTVKDTDPPILICSNVTLPNDSPNTFHGLTNDMYTYNDASPYPNVTYDVTEDALFAPGYTAITMFAVDEFNNSAECLFYVQNTLTELPVTCPDLNRTVRTDPHQATYNFTPDFGADNVTKSVDGYRYHGDAVSVNITLGGFPVGESVSIGTHEVVAIIFDDELEKKCTGIYIVEDDQPPNVTCSNQTILLGNVVSNYDVTVSDNVDEPSSLLINYAPKRPGQRLDLGINEISVNVTDLSGNINNAICYIDIQMTELPVDVIDAIAVSTGGTSFLSFNYRLNEDLTVHNFSFYGDGIDESIFVNGEGPQLGVLSSEVNNIVINATDGVLSKTFQFVLTVERNQTVSRILSGNVTLARIGDIVADFTDDLMDNSSRSYIDTAKEIQAQLDMIFRHTSGFIASRVISFRPGSVIATFVLIYDSSSSVTAEEATDIFRDAITNDEVNSGSGLYLSSSTSFFISFPCGRLICENDGVCTITNDGSEPMCRCTDDWTGDRCEIPNAQPNRVGIIVGATASALFLIIVTISLVMIAVRNRMIRMYQSSQDPSEFAPTYFNSHRDYSDESRGKPIVRHSKQEETKDYPYWNYAMDKDLVLFNKYKSRQQRRPSHNFRTRPYSTRRSPNHEPMHNGSRPTKNGIPLRDTYYVGHL